MNAPPLYFLRRVKKGYASSFLLDIEQLDINTGEVLCLLGPTGAGKSTLLRLLAGLDSPTHGEIQFGDAHLAAHKLPLNVQRRIAMVFQQPLLLTRTVRSNVEYGLRLRGTVRNASRQVDEVLDRLRLAHLASRSANKLSGGQMQLVALARALVIEPDVLLVDEPTANLDPAHVALVEGVLAEKNRECGMTIVWATHNLFQARRAADRVGLLLNGELVEVSCTETFFDHPSDSRTAEFVLGKMVY